MPWLIYDKRYNPWHHNYSVNLFAKRYIGYGSKEDKEFVGGAKIGVRSLARYYFGLLISVK